MSVAEVFLKPDTQEPLWHVLLAFLLLHLGQREFTVTQDMVDAIDSTDIRGVAVDSRDDTRVRLRVMTASEVEAAHAAGLTKLADSPDAPPHFDLEEDVEILDNIEGLRTMGVGEKIGIVLTSHPSMTVELAITGKFRHQ